MWCLGNFKGEKNFMTNKKNVKTSRSKNSKTKTKQAKKSNKNILKYVILGLVVILVLGGIAWLALKFVGSSTNDDNIDDNNSQQNPIDMPSQETYLDSNYITYQEVGYGSIGVDTDLAGDDISLLIDNEETSFAKGYFAHAYSVIMFSFSNIYLENISTYYGINKTQRNNGNTSMVFKIYVDGEEVFVSDQVDKNNPSGYVNLEFNKEISNIIFIIDDCGANGNDHGVWAEPKMNYRGEL